MPQLEKDFRDDEYPIRVAQDDDRRTPNSTETVGKFLPGDSLVDGPGTGWEVVAKRNAATS